MIIKRAKPTVPWQEFRVGRPSTIPKKPELTCTPLKTVFHVAHLEAGHRIIVDGKIRSGLIFDKSKLNQERILVSWLSPNYWFEGFRYGSVSFDFAWPRLAEGHRYYWVESIAYGVRACRILLTKKDYTGHHTLIPYDPAAGDGPWWFDETSGIHYWNGKFCLEFMVEHDLEISHLHDLNFVTHHDHRCSIDPQNCPERGMPHNEAASRFLARLAASKVVLPGSIRKNRTWKWRQYTDALATVAGGRLADSTMIFDGGLMSGDPESLAFGRALLAAYVNPKLHGDIPYLARHFRSREDMRECFKSLMKEPLAP